MIAWRREGDGREATVRAVRLIRWIEKRVRECACERVSEGERVWNGWTRGSGIRSAVEISKSPYLADLVSLPALYPHAAALGSKSLARRCTFSIIFNKQRERRREAASVGSKSRQSDLQM